MKSGIKFGFMLALVVGALITIFCLFSFAVERAADNSAAVALANGRAAIDYAAARQLDAGTAAIVADTAAAHDKARQFTTTCAVVALFAVTVAAFVVTYDNQRRQIAALSATLAELVATMGDNGRQGGDNV